MQTIPFLGASEPFSSYSHLLAAFAFLVFGIFVTYEGRGNGTRIFGLIIYVVTTVYLFSMSGVYHFLPKGTSANYVLRILDHAGIYTMIAGSLTPIQIILTRGFFRWIPLITIWVLAITGLTITAVFFEEMPEWLLLSFFLAMGWMSLITISKVYFVSRKVALGIVLGGVFYTLGALIDFLRWPIVIDGILGPHEIFHIFTIMGAGTHWLVIHSICARPISERVRVVVRKFSSMKFHAYVEGENLNLHADSDSEIKQKIKNWIQDHFFRAHRPKKIEFKYSEEEEIDIE